MKDDSHKGLESVGDEALEARLTAWVLGEASAFEVAELEELYRKDRGVTLFVDRLRLLDGLIREEDVEGWQLPDGKRSAVLDLLEPEIPTAKAKPTRHWWGLAAAAVVMLVAIAGSLAPMAMRQSKNVMSEPLMISYSALADSEIQPEMVEVLKRMQYDTEYDPPELPSAVMPAPQTPNQVVDGKPAVTAGWRSEGAALNRDSISELAEREVAKPLKAKASAPSSSMSRASGRGRDDLSSLAAKSEAKTEKTSETGMVPGVGANQGPSALTLSLDGTQAESAPAQDEKKGRVIALHTAAPEPVPVPEVELPEVATNFGDGEDVGAGWGSAAVEGGTWASRSSRGMLEAKDTNSANPEEKVPLLGDIPLTGTLFSESDDQSDALVGSGTNRWFGNYQSLNRSGDSLSDSPSGGLRQMLVPDEANAGDVLPPIDGDSRELVEVERLVDLSMDSGEVDRIEDLQRELGAVDELIAGGGPEFKKSNDAVQNDEPASGKGFNSLAQREGVRRAQVVSESDELRDRARERYAAGEYDNARKLYEESLEKLPDAPLMDDRRKFLSDSLADAEIATAAEHRKLGRYEEAKELLSSAVDRASDPSLAKQELEWLEDPVRTSPALTEEHQENIDKVRRDLYSAQGYFDTGQFDAAKERYMDALRTDPYNSAARRGLERIASAETTYYRAAYDHTRAQLLAEVDAAWELAVPAESNEKAQHAGEELEGFVNYGAPILGQDGQSSTEVAEDLVTEAVRVPDDFVLGLEAAGSSDEGQEIDAFAASEDGQGSALKARMNMKELLEMNGLTFPEGASVQFMASDSTVVVRNTRENLDLMQALVDQLTVEPPLDRMEEISASVEPYSTFSLHVSDSSFKLASAAMARGEVPVAESIRPEEFYNAFDYGDPAPASNEPVACVVEQSAHPSFPQRNLMRIGVRAGAAGRANATPLNLTLLLDNSGSMEREDRAEGVGNAMEQLASLLQPGDKVTVAGFSRQPRLLVDRLDGANAQQLKRLMAEVPSEGGTNLEEALTLGDELAKRQFAEGAENRVVLFTDGAANLGDADPESLSGRIEALRQNGIAFDAAGFGADGLNDRLLERLTRNGNGRYYVVDDPEEAGDGFAKKLAGAFRPQAENVKVQVVFNPARVGNYKLIGFEKHRLKKEDFKNDSVDAAEMASEESGVALYQFEVLPEGEGEVGEVSVRFRDVASGEMVERTWTIPYEESAPAFDQANESLQLAGLAAFLAEKLRNAPMADAVELGDLSPVMNKVASHYKENSRIQELKQMFEALR